ncbi:hypothetical protein TB2_014556 [Malus domestica]
MPLSFSWSFFPTGTVRISENGQEFQELRCRLAVEESTEKSFPGCVCQGQIFPVEFTWVCWCSSTKTSPEEQ